MTASNDGPTQTNGVFTRAASGLAEDNRDPYLDSDLCAFLAVESPPNLAEASFAQQVQQEVSLVQQWAVIQRGRCRQECHEVKAKTAVSWTTRTIFSLGSDYFKQ